MLAPSFNPFTYDFEQALPRWRHAVVNSLSLFGVLMFSGCGLTPGVAVSNELVPASALYLTSGNFAGSGVVSGTAQVFQNASTILLHLDGLVTPVGTLYTVFLETGNPSTPFYFAPLKASQGNQNYFTGQAPTGTIHFTRVVLRANSSTSSAEIASAILTAY